VHNCSSFPSLSRGREWPQRHEIQQLKSGEVRSKRIRDCIHSRISACAASVVLRGPEHLLANLLVDNRLLHYLLRLPESDHAGSKFLLARYDGQQAEAICTFFSKTFESLPYSR